MLRKRVDDYLVDLVDLREHAEKVVPQADSETRGHASAARLSGKWTVTPQSLLDAFVTKWKLYDVPLDYIFRGRCKYSLS